MFSRIHPVDIYKSYITFSQYYLYLDSDRICHSNMKNLIGWDQNGEITWLTGLIVRKSLNVQGLRTLVLIKTERKCKTVAIINHFQSDSTWSVGNSIRLPKIFCVSCLMIKLCLFTQKKNLFRIRSVTCSLEP